ncbi:MAG: N-acetyl sugar amidotransferase [Candidatus Scalindua sp.]|jgi:N-acetyl sugar amidotransferase|nr:N-acetyl sugar amidotransferase [Candidatus Scalindua sp.]
MVEKKNIVERYNLPPEVKFCKKCTISNQRPRISFDEEGVCSACRFAEYKNTKIDWNEREKELIELCKKYRRNDGSHDVVVPSSGGKDSAFTAHQLKYKYGMNPLTVTWAPHLYTDIGFKNLQSLSHVGGVDNVLFTPNGKVHRKLTKLSFEIIGDPFQPFIYGQVNVPLQIAVTHKIPLVMYGENSEAEYGGNMKNAFSPTRNYKDDITNFQFSGLNPEDLASHGISSKDMHAYLKPPVEELDKNKTEIHMLGYYMKWTPQENYYYAVENTGLTANPERSEGTYSKYASLDDKTDGFHYYLAFIKFGIGRAIQDSAHEIRDGHLTREEGVRLVQKYDGEFPQKYFKVFLEYCDITEEFFWEVIDSWRSPHLWEKVNGEWKLKHQIS